MEQVIEKNTEKEIQKEDPLDIFIIPKRVTIETIFGCNARCIMCPIDLPTKREKGIMPFGLFKDIIDSLEPYNDQFEMIDLFCLGEPLLDPHIFKRVKYVKEKGFKNIGISSNMQLLTHRYQKLLLESQLDNLIVSIDGVKKETHEKIRKRTTFEKVVNNTLEIIEMRNKGGYSTRFLLRFISQDANRGEWEPFKDYWSSKISFEKGDFITAYKAHSWAGQVAPKSGTFSKKDIINNNHLDPEIEKMACPDIFNALYILVDGTVPLCNEDWLHPNFKFGNVANRSPLDIYNDPKFQRIRKIHKDGNKNKLPMCNECTVHYSVKEKEVIKERPK